VQFVSFIYNVIVVEIGLGLRRIFEFYAHALLIKKVLFSVFILFLISLLDSIGFIDLLI